MTPALRRRMARRAGCPGEDGRWCSARYAFGESRSGEVPVMAGPGDEIRGRRPWSPAGLARRPRAGDQHPQGRVRAGHAGQGRIRPAGEPDVRGADPRGPGCGNRRPARRAGRSTAATARPCRGRAAGSAARQGDRGGDRAVCRRMAVHVPLALARESRAIPRRQYHAVLLDHPHLPVRFGHSCGVCDRRVAGEAFRRAACRGGQRLARAVRHPGACHRQARAGSFLRPIPVTGTPPKQPEAVVPVGGGRTSRRR